MKPGASIYFVFLPLQKLRLSSDIFLDLKENFPHSNFQTDKHDDYNSKELQIPARGFVQLSFFDRSYKEE